MTFSCNFLENLSQQKKEENLVNPKNRTRIKNPSQSRTKCKLQSLTLTRLNTTRLTKLPQLVNSWCCCLHTCPCVALCVNAALTGSTTKVTGHITCMHGCMYQPSKRDLIWFTFKDECKRLLYKHAIHTRILALFPRNRISRSVQTRPSTNDYAYEVTIWLREINAGITHMYLSLVILF